MALALPIAIDEFPTPLPQKRVDQKRWRICDLDLKQLHERVDYSPNLPASPVRCSMPVQRAAPDLSRKSPRACGDEVCDGCGFCSVSELLISLSAASSTAASGAG